MTENDYNRQIIELTQKRDALKRKTRDGHPIIVGQTYYEIFNENIEKVFVTKDTDFGIYSMNVPKSESSIYDYDHLWADLEKGKTDKLAELSSSIERTRKLLESQEAQLKRTQKAFQGYEEEIYSNDRT